MQYIVDHGEITKVLATKPYDAADLARLAETTNKKPSRPISVLELLPVERLGRLERKTNERILLPQAVFTTAESEPESAA